MAKTIYVYHLLGGYSSSSCLDELFEGRARAIVRGDGYVAGTIVGVEGKDFDRVKSDVDSLATRLNGDDTLDPQTEIAKLKP